MSSVFSTGQVGVRKLKPIAFSQLALVAGAALIVASAETKTARISYLSEFGDGLGGWRPSHLLGHHFS